MTSAPPVEYPVDIDNPDIEPYLTGNAGIKGITCFDSGKAGPHVMISAVVHGNEPCGAVALDWLFRNNIRPTSGKLSLGFMNIEAYQAYDRSNPTATRWIDEDFNRLWDLSTLDGERQSSELTRAREVRPWLETVDMLLDLHSMQRCQTPLMMAGPLEKGRDLAKRLGTPEHIVSDAGHAAGKRMRDFESFGDPSSPKNALLFEAGQHWEAISGPRTIEIVLRFLHMMSMIAPDAGMDFLSDRSLPPDQKAIEVIGPVTIESSKFTFADEFQGMEVLAEAGTLIGHDGNNPVVTPYDDCVLIMPSMRLWKGQTAVRLGRFVD
ncbi:MAG: succinylglutamate desuccinylase/aspartoacylase family protein [Alphaproteobacteria bacterium]|nr:succinylglutamate desuccinylase/aspartoacylase family protein [Alphaproteobacteria bacterium]